MNYQSFGIYKSNNFGLVITLDPKKHKGEARSLSGSILKDSVVFLENP